MAVKTNILIETRPTRTHEDNLRRRKNKNVCAYCGAPLSDPRSIARGAGRKCAENHMMIIFHIPAVDEVTATGGKE